MSNRTVFRLLVISWLCVVSTTLHAATPDSGRGIDPIDDCEPFCDPDNDPPPPAPTNINAPGRSYDGTFTVSFRRASTLYQVFLNRIRNGNKTRIPLYPPRNDLQISYREEGLAEGVYDYEAYACHPHACSAPAKIRVVVDYTPAVPDIGRLPAISDTGAYKVPWSAATGVLNYELYQSHNSGGWTRVYRGANREKPMTNVPDGTIEYRVRACNRDDRCGGYSSISQLLVRRPGGRIPPDISLPAQVSTGFTVAWHAASGMDLVYKLHRTSSGGGWEPVWQGPTRQYHQPPLPDDTYRYRVQACNDSGCGDWRASAWTEVINLPSIPGSLSGPGTTEYGDYAISWGMVQGRVDKYRLFERASGNSDWEIYETLDTAYYFADHTPGLFEYKVQACNDAAGCSADSPLITVSVKTPRSEPTVPPAAHLEPIPPVDPLSERVGAVEGEFAVSPSGALTYSVPIAIPTGTAGVQPSVSVNYSSQGGNGIMGVGWSLNAVSAITRCRQTKAQDQRTLPVTLTGSDRFCLDGQRLRVIAGTYGADAAEYRTELETHTKIVSFGNAGNGPTYFIVHGKDGSITEYGRSNDARIEANQAGQPVDTVQMWARNRVSDNMGNQIDYIYDEEPRRGQFVLAQISYGGREQHPVQAHHSRIAFNYSTDRVDSEVKFTAGSRHILDKLLTRIDIYDDQFNAQVRSYHFSYINADNPVSSRTRLLRIDECTDEYKSSCVRPLTFQWRQPRAGHESPQRLEAFGKAKVGDLNGDGLPDLLSYKGPHFEAFIAQENGYRRVPVVYQDDLRQWIDTTNDSLQLIDLNGDGLSDPVFVRRMRTHTYDVILNWAFYRTHWDADGQRVIFEGLPVPPTVEGVDTPLLAFNYSDELKFPQENDNFDIVTPSYHAIYQMVSNTHFTDVDGTGFVDIVYSHKGQLKAQLVDFDTFTLGEKRTLNFETRLQSDPENGLLVRVNKDKIAGFADFNGDGFADVIAEVSHITFPTDCPGNCDNNDPTSNTYPNRDEVKTWRVFLSDGQSTFTESYFVGSSVGVERRDIYPIDINADGLMDIVFRRGDDLYWKLNTGLTFLSGSLAGVLGDAEALQFFDYNNDGFWDLAYADRSGSSAQIKVRLWDGANAFTANTYDTPFAPPPVSDDNYFLFPDLNGNGRADFLAVNYDKNDTSAEWYYYNDHDSDVVHDVITTINGGYGDYLNITYDHLHARGTYALRPSSDVGADACNQACAKRTRTVTGSLPVVSAVNSPGSSNGSDSAWISYFYKNLKIDTYGRGPLGFREVYSQDYQSRVLTRTVYRQHFPFTGLAERTETYKLTSLMAAVPTAIPAGARRLSESRNYWETIYQVGMPGVARVQLQRTDETLYEPFSSVSLSTTETSYAYDPWGNVLESTVSEIDAGSGDTVVQETVNSFRNDTTRWWLGRLEEVVVTNSRNGTAAPIRRSIFDYDANTGLLIKEVTEPDGDVSETLINTYQHDAYGNIVKTTQCSRHIDDCGYDTTQQLDDPYWINRSESSIYDESGRHVVSTLNARGWETSRVLARGPHGPLHMVSLNGSSVETVYDGFGRPYFYRNSDGSFSLTLQRECEASTCPSIAVSYSETRSGGEPSRRIFVDQLGRTVRKSVQGFDGRWIHTDTTYDNLSRVVSLTEPYFEGTPAPLKNLSEYDFVGRDIATTLPDGSRTTITYDGFTTVTANALGQTTTEVKNAAGEVLSITDHTGFEVSYSYDTLGSLVHIAPGHEGTVMEYDRLGRKIAVHDPHKGHWRYRYNARSEQILVTDAKQQQTHIRFDDLGRQVRKWGVDNAGTLLFDRRWSYDGTHARGKVIEETEAVAGFTQRYSYDSLSRITQRQTIDRGRHTYTDRTTYDEFGRVYQQFDTVGPHSALRNHYNEHGYPFAISHDLTGKVYQRVVETNARGQILTLRHGNGALTSRSYDPAFGRVTGIVTYDSSGMVVQDLDYQYDVLGNLKSRRNDSGDKNVREEFIYDNLNRIKQAVTDQVTQNFDYDHLGNLTLKTGAGDYQYGSGCGGPQAVCQTDDGHHISTYRYDDNGNMIEKRRGHAITTMQYTGFDKLSFLSSPGQKTTFKYDTGGQRYQRADEKNNVGTVLTTYIGNVEVTRQTYSNEVVYRRYIGTHTLEVIIHNEHTGNTERHTEYLLKDHLGSLDIRLDALSRVVGTASFDAFGQRRNTTDWSALDLDALSNYTVFDRKQTTIGYTGHEQIDAFGLVHMNGRMYNPVLGRFLQADPFVQEPHSTQNHNRYSYVLNNPLSYTDPSGYFFQGLGFGYSLRNVDLSGIDPQTAFLTLYGIAATAITAGALGPLMPSLLAGAVGGAVGAFLPALATAGNSQQVFKATLLGAVTGAAFAGAGSLTQKVPRSLQKLTKVSLHAGIGGVTTVLNNGKFGHGFLSAGVSAVMGGYMDRVGIGTQHSWGESLGRVGIAAAVGGTVSEITGGKFANGALTAAYARALNDGLHPQQREPTIGYDEKDNNITMIFKMRFEGTGAGNTEVINKFIAGIEGYWSGKFGKYQVTSKVQLVAEGKGRANVIDVVEGRGISHMDFVGSINGTWYTQGNKSRGWVAAHEVGHLFDLVDLYDTKTGKVIPATSHLIMGGKDLTPVHVTEMYRVINWNRRAAEIRSRGGTRR